MPWDVASFTGWWQNRSGYVLRLPHVGQVRHKLRFTWWSDGFFWRASPRFCWRGPFAGATFASKTAPAKFKMHQQNFRCASKIINPNDFDMPR